VRDVEVDEPGWRAACGERFEVEDVRDTVFVTRAVEVGGAGDERGDAASVNFVHEGSSDAGADLALARAGRVGRVFGHGAADLSIHVDVVEDDEACVGALAGLDGVGHDAGPEVLPDGKRVLEADEKMDGGGASDGANGLVGVGEVGGEEFGGAYGPGAAADEAHAGVGGEEDACEFVGDRAAGLRGWWRFRFCSLGYCLLVDLCRLCILCR
jgi:hypothetical protein